MNRSWMVAVLLGRLLSASSTLSGAEEKKPIDPDQATEARRTLVAWFECEECSNGELEAVVKLGQLAVPNLAAALRGGPSPASREKLRRHLLTTYQDLLRYQKTHPESKLPISEADYVKTYTENYIAQYQIRSAIALGSIGVPEARRVLEEASKVHVRADVKAVLEGISKKTKE
jgi:hypothetical protein